MKNKLRCVFLLMMSSFLSTFTFANTLDQNIEALIKRKAKGAQVGVMVQDFDTGDILYHRQADMAFYPASNTKLFSAAAALKILGESYTFKTTLMANLNHVKNQSLEGPLYIKFSGDPALKLKDLRKLFDTLKEKKITKLAGNIIIDDTAFSDGYWGAGWTVDSMPWYYSAPVSAIIINQNKTAIQIGEAKGLSKPLRFSHKAKFPSVQVNTDVMAVKKAVAEKECQLHVTQLHDQYDFSGCWPVEHTPLQVEVSYNEPRELAAEAIQSILKQKQIAFSGNILFNKADSKATMLASHESDRLAQLIKPVLDDSNNLYADAITKTLGLAKFDKGSFQQGVNAIQSALNEHFNLPIDGYKLFDGSGASRYTLISPAYISELLFQMKNDPSFQAFYDALSVSGQSGKLETRMQEMSGKVIAKTGSAMGTTALAGYLTAESNKRYIFTFIINQSTEKTVNLKLIEDQFCKILYESKSL